MSDSLAYKSHGPVPEAGCHTAKIQVAVIGDPYDVQADVVEAARCPVVMVCSASLLKSLPNSQVLRLSPAGDNKSLPSEVLP